MNSGHGLSKSGQALVSSALAKLVLDVLHANATSPPTHQPSTFTLDDLDHALNTYITHAGPTGGLRMGEQASMASFGVLGYLVMSSTNLGQVIHLMQRYEQVVMHMGETTLHRQGTQVRLGWGLRGHHAHPALEDLILAAWFKLGRWLVGRELVPDAVYLTHRAAQHAPDYRTWFGCPVELDQATAGVVFPATWLDLPVLHADPQMHSWMVERASAQMRALSGDGPWSQQVVAILPELMASQSATLGGAAAALGIGERSLRRRLNDEGNGFAALLLQERQALACRYLRHTQHGVLDIALALGYAEHSAFSGAFKQWFGMTPRDYRSHHGAVPAGPH